MARENQGLQIALIVAVIFTIALGVTTFMFYKQAEEKDIAAKAAAESEKKQRDSVDVLTKDVASLKEMMGFAQTDAVTAIREQFNKDMQPFVASYEGPSRFYHQLVPKLYEELQKKNASLADAQTAIKKLDDDYKQKVNEKDGQVTQFSATATKAGEELVGERKKFGEQHDQLSRDKDDLAKKLQGAQKEAEQALAQVQGKLEDVNTRMQRLQLIVAERTKQLDDVKKTSFETAHGKIRWVNQRNGTVWINLGQADYLGRQVSFSVYAADTNDVTKAAKKADVEVTQILGEHLAEARIVNDTVSNPIMPGDVIYTPLWRPGEPQHIALAGDIDIDNDGKSDLRMVLNLITMNGAVVDLYMDENGKKVGKLTTNTRFLVIGKAPEVKAGQKTDKTEDAVHSAYSSIMKEAGQLGIQSIPLHELLKRMGFKHETHVVRFGPGANPADFRAQPPEGVPKVSSGTASPVFERRQTPRGSTESAY